MGACAGEGGILSSSDRRRLLIDRTPPAAERCEHLLRSYGRTEAVVRRRSPKKAVLPITVIRRDGEGRSVPLSAKRFERGVERPSIEDRVVSFLHANPDRAFSVREVAVVVEPERFDGPVDATDSSVLDRVRHLATVSSILDSLVDDGALERRIVDDGRRERSYYRSRSRSGSGLSN